MQYWVHVIIQDEGDSRPWHCSPYTCCTSLKEARKQVENYRENYRVLCSWISRYKGDKKLLDIDAKSYINVLGYLC